MAADETDAPDALGGLVEDAAPAMGATREHALAHVQRGLFGSTAPPSIGRYRPLARLGSGGQGSVWSAHDPELGRDVAIKLLHVRPDAGGDARSQLLQEARALAQLTDPRVLAVLDVGEHKGGVFMVTELVDGADLRAWLRAEARAWREVLGVVLEAARALAVVHAEHVLHRDIKPANILVGRDGRVRLADFGLACAAESVSETSAGTPVYMAPEQLAHGGASEAADQYALCVTAWEALCGTPPFVGDTMDALVRAKLGGRPQPTAGRTMPRALVRAIVRGLSPRPEERWPSVAALVRVLERCASAAARRARAGRLVLSSVVALPWLAIAAPPGEPTDAPAGDDACAEVDAAWAEAWSPAREQMLRTTLRGEHADEVGDRFLARVAALGDEWRGATCAAASAAADDSRELDCLVRWLAELDVTLSTLERVEGASLVALSTLSALHPPSHCRDASRLPAPPEQHRDAIARARTHVVAARVYRVGEDYTAALGEVEAAARIVADVDHDPVRAEVEQARAMVLEVRGDVDAAERAYTTAHHLATAALHDIVATQTAIGLTTLIGLTRRDVDGGLEWARFAAAALRRIEGMQAHPLCEAYLESALGSLDDARGDAAGYLRHVQRALEIVEHAMGPSDPSVGLMLSNLGIALQRVGRHAEAEVALERALAVQESALGPDHRNIAVVLHNLGAARLELGRHAEALPVLRRALAIRERVLAPGEPATAYTRLNLAIALQHTGGAPSDLAEAESLARRAHEALVERLGPTHARTVLASETLAAISLARGPR